ncbi:MAG TPA: sulfite exporter TauE/SafE family protein, partial [Terriglobales bacterium]
MRRWRLAGVVLSGLMSSVFSFAHPMGNFSINHESKITLNPRMVEVRYFLDFAEIPTYQEFQSAGISAKADDPAVSAYAIKQGRLLSQHLLLEVDGHLLPLRLTSHAIIFPPGAGGLPTMKLGFVYQSNLPAEHAAMQHRLRFEDHNYADRTGWKEVVISAHDVSLHNSSVPQVDRSAELSNYPTDLVNSPPQQMWATAEFRMATSSAGALAVRRASHAVAPAKEMKLTKNTVEASVAATPMNETFGVRPNVQQTPRSRFTELIATQHLSFWFVLSAVVIALALGALHALEPGHGKTIVGAYLVGSRGSTRDAVLLGATVTAAHTAGVYLLGLLTLYASRYVVPEKLYPWLSVLSGLLIVAVGIVLFLQHWTGSSMAHDEDPARPHSHWKFGSSLRKSASSVVVASAAGEQRHVSFGQLITLGITGGIIPCPAALVVLLSAVALHRIGFGLLLIVAFSIGLASVLIAIGILMVNARKLIAHFNDQGRLVTRWLPIISSLFVIALGIAMLWQPASTLRLNLHFNQPQNAPALLAMIGLGLLLGVRHSTDADHVVAVTTIVSQQRRVRDAAMIGALWGVGHTLTIAVVGSAIILFNVAIPPRMGLSMEFSVAIMLIVLGVLNLTGIMQWITERLASTNKGTLIQNQEGAGQKTESLLDGVASRFGAYQVIR